MKALFCIILFPLCLCKRAFINQNYTGSVSTETASFLYKPTNNQEWTMVRISVSSSATEENLLFIVVRTARDVESFALPVIIEHWSFSSFENLICTKSDFTVDISASQDSNVSLDYTLKAFYENLNFSNLQTVEVAPNKPHSFVIKKTSSSKYTFTKLISGDDNCAMAIVQSQICSVDFRSPYETIGKYQTFYRKAGFTITASDFFEDYEYAFISIVVFPTKDNCKPQSNVFAYYLGTAAKKRQMITNANQSEFSKVIEISTKIYKDTSFIGVISVTIFVFAVIPFMFGICLCCCKTKKSVPPSNYVSEAQEIVKSSNLSKLLIIVGIVYLIPAIQLVFIFPSFAEETGNGDLCYQNFWCRRPLWIFEDFNHVLSNIGYIGLGLLSVLITFTKSARCYEKTGQIPKHFQIYYALNIGLILEGIFSGIYHLCPNWLNFQFDITFMMTIALTGLLAMYQKRHPNIPPKAENAFIFMAIILILAVILVFIPDKSWEGIAITIAGHIAIVGTFICFYYYGNSEQRDHNRGAATKRYSSKNTEETSFNNLENKQQTSNSDSVHSSTVIFIYAMKVIQNKVLKVLKITKNAFGEGQTKSQIIVTVSLVIINVIVAVITTILVVFETFTLPHYLLFVFIVNLVVYFIVYFCVKHCCCKDNENESEITKEKISKCAVIWTIVAGVCWPLGVYFFVNATTNWRVSPATSRNGNTECIKWFDFYDFHDIWHFLSAFALFSSYLVMIHIDENLDEEQRIKHGVF